MLPSLQVHCFPVSGDVACPARAVLLRAGVMRLFTDEGVAVDGGVGASVRG